MGEDAGIGLIKNFVETQCYNDPVLAYVKFSKNGVDLSAYESMNVEAELLTQKLGHVLEAALSGLVDIMGKEAAFGIVKPELIKVLKYKKEIVKKYNILQILSTL
jgi:hypothetical protein